MKSPKQARAASTPKSIKFTGGKSCCGPMASGRASPASKTSPTLYNKTPMG